MMLPDLCCCDGHLEPLATTVYAPWNGEPALCGVGNCEKYKLIRMCVRCLLPCPLLLVSHELHGKLGNIDYHGRCSFPRAVLRVEHCSVYPAA